MRLSKLLEMVKDKEAWHAAIHGVMEKVGETKEYLINSKYDNIEISVDGSVSCERAKYMRQQGATIFVGGTAGIFRKGMRLEETIKAFKESIK